MHAERTRGGRTGERRRRASGLPLASEALVDDPMVTVLALFGLLLVFTQGSALAPFIYTLF